MWTRRILFLTLGLAALLFYAYANHYQNVFHFDDTAAIENNVSLQSPANLGAFLTERSASSSEPTSQIYRPVSSLSLALDYWWGGLDVATYHRTSFILYVVLLLLLFSLFKAISEPLFEEKWSSIVAFGSAAVFGLHAVNAETLNYISARGILLAAIFSTAALLLYVRGGRTRTKRIYLLPFTLALLSDQQAVCVVGLIFLHHLIFEGHNGEPAPRRLQRAFFAALPALVVGTLASFLVLSMTSEEARHPLSVEYILTQPYVVAEYAASFFYPIGLSAASGLSVFSDFDSWRSICGQVFLLCLLALAVLSLERTRARLIGFGLFWFVIALIPSSCLFGSAAVLDYRRTFFPYAGLAFGICSGAALLYENLQSRSWWRPRYLGYVNFLLLALMATHVLVIRHRNRVWASEETLWFDVIAKNPGYGPGYMSYGLSKMEKNDYDLARLYLEEALKYLPESPQLHTDLGTLYGRISKDPSLAEGYFQRALALSPDYAPAYLAYGQWLLSRHQFEQALSKFERSDSLSENSLQARYALMDTYSLLGRWAKVREIARKTLAEHPEDTVAQRQLALADARPAEEARHIKASVPPAPRLPGSSQTPG